MKHRNSFFVAIDGIDGVGKSTQIERLENVLRREGHACLVTRDPGSTEIGLRLRTLLLSSDLTMHRRTEAMLFMASRCEMVESTIRPALASGTSVITDRFLLANVVYQSIGENGEGVIDPDLLWQIGDLANGGLKPDVTILLDMPAETALSRLSGQKDRMESRGPVYMESVRQMFLRQLPRSGRMTSVINADRSVEVVSAELEETVLGHLDSVASSTRVFP